MIFGRPDRFAIESRIESGAGLPTRLGTNVLGRMRLHIGGRPFGNVDEPACVIAVLHVHLRDILASDALWSDTLAPLDAKARFHALDDLVYTGRPTDLPDALHATVFLTNASEAFDGIKAFILRPPGTRLEILVAEGDDVLSLPVEVADLADATHAFGAWVAQCEREVTPAPMLDGTRVTSGPS